MKLKLTMLQKVDLAIGIGFSLMLTPLLVQLGNSSYSRSDYLGHFADVLGVAAALYAGRTAFFKEYQQSESPEWVFGVMSYLLAGYAVIKCWAFIDKSLDPVASIVAAEALLLFLMAAFVAPFSWLALKNAVTEEKSVFARVVLAVVMPVALLIFLLWLVAKYLF